MQGLAARHWHATRLRCRGQCDLQSKDQGGGQRNAREGASWWVVNVNGFQWEEREGKVDLHIKERKRCKFLGAHTRGSIIWWKTTSPWAQGHLLCSGHFSPVSPLFCPGGGGSLVQVCSARGCCYVTYGPAGMQHQSLAFPTASWPGWTHPDVDHGSLLVTWTWQWVPLSRSSCPMCVWCPPCTQARASLWQAGCLPHCKQASRAFCCSTALKETIHKVYTCL